MNDLNKVKLVIQKCYSYSDVIRALDWHINASYIKKLKQLILEGNINISHFDRGRCHRKYKTIEKVCPICDKSFNTLEQHPREKATCSHGCANTYFRSGLNNGMFKASGHGNYRHYAMLKFPHKCNRCSWAIKKEILHVHHKNRDRNDNNLSNLEILCPNCHYLEHYEQKDGLYRWRK